MPARTQLRRVIGAPPPRREIAVTTNICIKVCDVMIVFLSNKKRADYPTTALAGLSSLETSTPIDALSSGFNKLYVKEVSRSPPVSDDLRTNSGELSKILIKLDSQTLTLSLRKLLKTESHR